MNNSRLVLDGVKLSLDDKVDMTEQLGIEESRLVKLIEALMRISATEDWRTLKSLIFDRRLEQLDKQMKAESERLELKDSEIYRLQGRLYEARKYDLENLVEVYRQELSNIRKLITQPTER